MKKIKEFFMRLKLRRQKERAVFEVRQDIAYLIAFKSGMLDYDESKARKRMAELKGIENKSEAEHQELENIIDLIAESKAVKTSYQQTKSLLTDLENYISIL